MELENLPLLMLYAWLVVSGIYLKLKIYYFLKFISIYVMFIILLLGGKPAAMARSNDLSQVVKRGKEGENNSYVEIDILVDASVATIKRILSCDSGQSKWFYNNRSSSQREVKLLMASLNIDVDNLCSFMPQDRVGKFASYTPKERLQNTLKTIACSSSLGGNSTSTSTSARPVIGSEEEDGDGIEDSSNLYEIQMKLAHEERAKISLENDRALKEREVTKLKQELNVAKQKQNVAPKLERESNVAIQKQKDRRIFET